MSGSMRASFTLTLEDKLTAGLKGIQDALGRLKDKGNQLTLGGLDRASGTIGKLITDTRALTQSLTGVQAAAGRAFTALQRMTEPVQRGWARLKNFGGRAFGPASRVGAFGAAVEGYSVLAPIQRYADFQNIALHSAITKGLSGQAANTEANRLMALFRRDALETGQSSTSIAQAYQDLIQTGISPEQAEKLLPIHSRAATAYNISAAALSPAVMALSKNFGIGEDDMGGALASMALASKSGRFKVEDFSHYLPSIGGDLAKLGMKGRGSADLAFAALETIMQNSADPASGAANFKDFMNAIVSPYAARSFALESRTMAPQTRAMLDKYHVKGIDLPAVLEDARKKGIDPITAVLQTLQKKVAGLPPDVMAEVLGAFLGNQQSRDAAQAMLMHMREMNAMRKHLGDADPQMMDRDFKTAVNSPVVQLRLLTEKLDQLAQRAGRGFLPVLSGINAGLSTMMSIMDRIDAVFPGLSDGVLAITGGMLALGAAIGIIGAIMPALTAGFAALEAVVAVMSGPIGLVALAVGAIGYLIYRNWGSIVPILRQVGHYAAEAFHAFMAFEDSILTAELAAIKGAIEAILHPLKTLEALLQRFHSGGETSENEKALSQLNHERQSLDGGPLSAPQDGFDVYGRPVASHAHVTIHTDPGTTATVNSTTPGVSVHLNPGQTTGRK